MKPIVECVPNFSEGTDLSLVEDIVSAIKTAKILDVHSDPDHNRSVVTILGEPEAVARAAFNLTERAMQLLNINEHSGQHPFIGVVDVIPFVPIVNCPMSEVQSLAHAFGREIWEKLKLPVYFYGEVAKIPERKELPYIRRGGYSLLKQEIGQVHRKPDIGHGLHITAGAVAVGVRDYLVALNVNLDTRDVDIARSIAKNIREKDGGLPGIRALGVELPSRGHTQATLNIVDYKKTSLKQAFDEVKRWAKEYKVGILGSEIVGLIPKSAVFPGMKEYLNLPYFSEEEIIENHL